MNSLKPGANSPGVRLVAHLPSLRDQRCGIRAGRVVGCDYSNVTTDDLEVTASAFSDQARRLCSIIESVPNAELSIFLRELHAALAVLYACAIELPPVERETDQAVDGNVTDEEWEALVLRLASYLADTDAYWEVFDPYDRNDPVSGRLSDDLADIWPSALEWGLVPN